jgi:outer membrane lipoprotein-sorting protein
MKSLKLKATRLSLVIVLAILQGASAYGLDAAEILKKVDVFRNPLDSFVIDVKLTSHRDGAKTEDWDFRVYGRGSDKSLVEFLSPASEKGRYLLMLNDAMWIYMPNTSRPIRISPLQRLMGEASNGDVARTNYSVDYIAEPAGEDEVEGVKTYVLNLRAKDPGVSYSRVRLWVNSRNFEPVQSEFYVASGKLMKRAFFREFGTMNGMRTVTKIEIHDVVRPGRWTLMSYANLQPRKVPDKMFNKNYLGKW